MLTTTDLKKIKEITRDEIQTELRKELKNDIVTFKDEILHEIVAFREEMAVVTGYSDRIEDHDQRIEKLETAVY